MTPKFLKCRWQKITAAVLSIFVIIISIIAFFINQYWSPILAREVKSTVLNSTDSLYVADFKDARLNVLQGKIVLYDITIKPNMPVYNRRLKIGLAPNNLYTLKVKRIVFQRIHPLRLYRKNQLNINKIIISEPELKVTYHLVHTRDTLTFGKLNAWQRIKSILKSIHVNQVLLNDVKFRYEDYTGAKLDVSELKEMNLTGNNLQIDSATQNDTSRFLYFKEVQIELNNFIQPSNNGLYTYRIKQLNFSTLTSQLNAFGLSLIPASEQVFASKKSRIRFACYLDTVQINHFDFATYNKYHLFNSSHVVLTRGNFSIAVNPMAQARKTDRLITFPNVAIHQLGSQFRLDTVDLQSINIAYKGYGKKSHKPGQINFNNTSGSLYNVSNQASALALNPVCSLQLSSYLMNQGLLNTTVTFNLTDSAKTYAYKGTLGSMKLDKLNPVTIPFGLLKITSGNLTRLDFDVKGNRNVATGTVGFQYSNLKVKLFKMDTATARYKRMTIVSLLANNLVIKRNNPDQPGQIARLAQVTYVRQPDTPFFKTVWKTLSRGIKACAGYDAAMEKHVKQQIAQHAIDKKKRKIRKAQRDRRKIEKGRKKRRH
ncbi:hypothetical protein HH214_13060 [Mucilaginibacter robiniae]|uniref:DUF748 domain-containing protein n=1 Tax=Mucilaginibacter robiniae TaxID=2728022 RepID=A0A7L5E043_9SPHI|nr:hypothetical protein [Mucilaginibacter robiniae]QJD96732.1 hypothetical protein HH214_13060 [Mucilaginibacter robiniae]